MKKLLLPAVGAAVLAGIAAVIAGIFRKNKVTV